MELASILSIAASIVAIIYPFIADFLASKKNPEALIHVEGDITVNFNQSAPSKNKKTRISKVERKSEITEKIYKYIVEARQKLNSNIKMLILISIVLSLINLVSHSITGVVPLLTGYMDYVLHIGFFNKHVAYVIILLTFFILYFSVTYFITLYIYDKKLASLVVSNDLWIDYGSLKVKMINNKTILKSIHYPSRTISRVEENKVIETKNKAKRTKGDHKFFPEKTFFSQYNFIAPLFIILIINIVFLLLSSKIEKISYMSRINKDSIVYEENKLLTGKDQLFLLPQQFYDGKEVTFKAIKNDGYHYQVTFDSIETTEPISNFTRSGQITTNTHLRYSPYGPEGETRNSNKPTLSVNQLVRVHKLDGQWMLVLTPTNRQGFVYYEHLHVFDI